MNMLLLSSLLECLLAIGSFRCAGWLVARVKTKLNSSSRVIELQQNEWT